MSEYQHKDKKEYIIAEGIFWRVWNNGIVEQFYSHHWEQRNNLQTWKERLKFLKCWEKAEIGKSYDFSWYVPNERIETIGDHGASVFLGFKEQCPECKKSYMVWENKIQLCKGCDYIHAFMVDDDN